MTLMSNLQPSVNCFINWTSKTKGHNQSLLLILLPYIRTPKLSTMNAIREIAGLSASYDVTPVSAKRGRYKRYSIQEKKTIVTEAEDLGFQPVSRKYGIADSTLYTWRKWLAARQTSTGEKMGKYRRIGTGNRLRYSVETDQRIVSWVLRQRDMQLPVSQENIQMYAMKVVCEENPNFKASRGWLEGFMKRNNLSTRRKTTLSQKMPADLQIRIDVFHKYLEEVRQQKEFDPEMIINMDEVPMYFDFVPRQTVNMKGVKDVPILTTGGEKRHFTVVLAVTASGTKLPPMIIFKGTRPLNLPTPDGWIVRVNPTAWMTQDLMMVWLQQILKVYTERRPTLLVMDSFAAHITQDIRRQCDKLSCTTAVIPGGCTSKLQPLDVCLNKPFKDSLRRSWSTSMRNKVTETGVASSSTKGEIVEWIDQAWNSLSTELVAKSFRVTGISTCPTEETFETDSEDEFEGFVPEDLGPDYGTDPFTE